MYHPVWHRWTELAWRSSLGALAFLLVACGAPAPSGGAATEAPAAAENSQATQASSRTPAKEQVLRAGISRNLVNGEEDWIYTHTNLQVWEPLIRYDDQLRPQPGLAESWTRSDDARTWTFTLRQGVTFSNGDPLTVEDVLASIEHFRQASGRPSIFLGGINFPEIYGDPTAIEKVDDRSFRIVYDTPRPLLIYSISNHYSAVFSAKNFDENSYFKGPPIGTGPYVLADWKRDQYAILERNENYWGEKPTLTRIELRIYPNANSRVSALKAGEVDALVELGAVSAAQARELSSDPSFVVTKHASTCTTQLSFNGTKAPFNDIRLRQAISLSIDRDAFVRDLLYGFATPAKTILISPDATFLDTSPAAQLQYSPDQAKTLVGEALNGGRAKAVLIFSPPGEGITAWPYPQIAAYLQATLAPVGFDIELRQLEAAALTDARNNGDFDLVLSNNCWASGDPNYILRRLTHSEAALNVAQHGGYSNPEVDQLLDQGLVETDTAKQLEEYHKIQQIAAAEIPIAPLFDQPTIIAYRPFVKGLSQRVAYAPSFETTWLEEQE